MGTNYRTILDGNLHEIVERVKSIDPHGASPEDVKFLLDVLKETLPDNAFHVCTAPSVERRRFRPPSSWEQVERWTGTEWIPDDGKKGNAFNGIFPHSSESGRHHYRTPVSISKDCECTCINPYCLVRVSMSRGSTRFGACNGTTFAEKDLR